MSVTALRPLRLGPSEIPAVLELDRWCSPYELAQRKLGRYEPPITPAALMGVALEPAHRALLTTAGYEVDLADPDGYTHPGLDWFHGHPDCFVTVEGERVPVELKARGLPPDEDVLLRDRVQALLYAELLDAPAALLSELHGGRGGLQRSEYLLEREPGLLEVAVPECEAFLALLRKGRAPAPDGSQGAREAVRAMFANGDPEQRVRATPAILGHVKRCRELLSLRRAAEAQYERHAEAIQEYMREAVELLGRDDEVIAKWSAPSPTRRIDSAKLRAKYPLIAAEFETVTTQRRFGIV